jgi:hypothetical protein
MKVFAGTCSSLTACIVVIAMVASPVMAQNALTAPDPAGSAAPAANGNDNPGNPVVDISSLPELPLARTGSAFPTASRNSTLPAPGASSQPKPSSDVDAPGQSKWLILAALVVAGAVTAVVLLLHGGGGDDARKPTTPPKPTGTIITAGTPGVTNPR